MTSGPSCNFGGSKNPPDSPLCHQFQNCNKLCYRYKSLRNTELDDIKNKLYVQVLIIWPMTYVELIYISCLSYKIVFCQRCSVRSFIYWPT
jgi:hypothetical protein